MTNFSLMFAYIKSLMKLVIDDDDNFSDQKFKQYCSAFDQLLQIIESEEESIPESSIEALQNEITVFEERLIQVQDKIQDKISKERLKVMTTKAYGSKGKHSGFDKKL